MMADLQNAARRFRARTGWTDVERGVITRLDGRTLVRDVDGKTDLVYVNVEGRGVVLVRRGNYAQGVQEGVEVDVGVPPGGTVREIYRLAVGGSGVTPARAIQHGDQHQLQLRWRVAPTRSAVVDPVFVSARQITNGNVVAPTAGFVCTVKAGQAIIGGTILVWSDTTVPDLAGDVPSAGEARGVLVEMDRTATVYTTLGDAVSTPVSDNDLLATLTPTTDRLILAVVHLYGGQTAIRQHDILPLALATLPAPSAASIDSALIDATGAFVMDSNQQLISGA